MKWYRHEMYIQSEYDKDAIAKHKLMEGALPKGTVYGFPSVIPAGSLDANGVPKLVPTAWEQMAVRVLNDLKAMVDDDGDTPLDPKHMQVMAANIDALLMTWEQRRGPVAAPAASAGEQTLRKAFGAWARTQGNGEIDMLDVLSPDEAEAEFDKWKVTLVEKPLTPQDIADKYDDKARLDFIQEHGATIEILPAVQPGRWVFRVNGERHTRQTSVRDAIDAAKATKLL